MSTQTREETYEVRQRIQKAMRELRDLEDFARLKIDNHPLADRVRVIHELLTEDVIKGSVNRPGIKARHEDLLEAVLALHGEELTREPAEPKMHRLWEVIGQA